MSNHILPTHHVRPPRGWINDPNGLAHVDGAWHVFFQYNPASHRHDAIRWGHATSTNLLDWQLEPDVLVPEPEGINAVGSWSGCLTVDDGVPTICCTAVATTPAAAVGAIARGSADLRSWELEQTPAAPAHGEAGAETRDPFVVWIEGHRYILQGHGGRGTTASILVHDAEDLTNWPLLGELVTVADPVAAQHAPADIWECPNLVQLGKDWVLVVSLWLDGQLTGVRWLLGELKLDQQDGTQVPRFSPRTGGVLDTGPCFYAPQLVTHQGRTLLIGWSWELERSDEVLAEQGWAGVLTTPRELSVRDGRLVQDLPREVLEAAAEQLDPSWRAAEHPCVLVRATSAVVLTCDLAEGESRLELPAGSTAILDGSLVEVFHEGSTRTTRCYPELAATWSVTGRSEVRVLG